VQTIEIKNRRPGKKGKIRPGEKRCETSDRRKKKKNSDERTGFSDERTKQEARRELVVGQYFLQGTSKIARKRSMTKGGGCSRLRRSVENSLSPAQSKGGGMKGEPVMERRREFRRGRGGKLLRVIFREAVAFPSREGLFKGRGPVLSRRNPAEAVQGKRKGGEDIGDCYGSGLSLRKRWSEKATGVAEPKT